MTFLQPVVSWIRRRILLQKPERWDHQYTHGRWENLKSPLEQARFDACADFLRRHARGGQVLELGCGEALLQRRVAPEDYGSWFGVDISAVAIAKAETFAGARVRYVVADMATLQLDGSYDAIVFPESIYYVAQRVALLQRYAGLLGQNGVFIISIFGTKRSAKVWEEIHSVAEVIDSSVTTNELGTWVCEVLRMR